MEITIINTIGIIGLLLIGAILLSKPMVFWFPNGFHMMSVEAYQKRYSKIVGASLIILAFCDLARIIKG